MFYNEKTKIIEIDTDDASYDLVAEYLKTNGSDTQITFSDESLEKILMFLCDSKKLKTNIAVDITRLLAMQMRRDMPDVFVNFGPIRTSIDEAIRIIKDLRTLSEYVKLNIDFPPGYQKTVKAGDATVLITGFDMSPISYFPQNPYSTLTNVAAAIKLTIVKIIDSALSNRDEELELMETTQKLTHDFIDSALEKRGEELELKIEEAQRLHCPGTFVKTLQAMTNSDQIMGIFDNSNNNNNRQKDMEVVQETRECVP